MNVALLQRLYAAPPIELAGELQAACAALPAAASTAYGKVRDLDRTGLDLLERLAERGEGIRRLAMRTREALARETNSPNAA
jgi:hypothetical protein